MTERRDDQQDPGGGVGGTEALRPGDLVDGRYAIEEVLGSGGMAVVYRARHVGLEHQVALKVVLPQVRSLPGVSERFLREARAATRLRSDHVAHVFDVGTTDDGTPYFVMELLEGFDLGSVVAERGPLPEEEAVGYVLQACEALAEVHGIGMVHRDLKPANLFLTEGADGLPHVKLIDFGISRVETPLNGPPSASLTQPAVMMGSPRYMAPEQMEDAAQSDERSDIWGLGTVLYELLTGEPPYDGASFLDIYAAALRGPPVLPSRKRSDVRPGLDAVVLRCLAVDPSKRYADVATLARALVPFGPIGSEVIAQSTERVWRSARERAGVTDGPEVTPLALPDEGEADADEPSPPSPLPVPLSTQLEMRRRGRDLGPSVPRATGVPRHASGRDDDASYGPAMRELRGEPRRGRRGLWLGLALMSVLAAGGVRAWTGEPAWWPGAGVSEAADPIAPSLPASAATSEAPAGRTNTTAGLVAKEATNLPAAPAAELLAEAGADAEPDAAEDTNAVATDARADAGAVASSNDISFGPLTPVGAPRATNAPTRAAPARAVPGPRRRGARAAYGSPSAASPTTPPPSPPSPAPTTEPPRAPSSSPTAPEPPPAQDDTTLFEDRQ